ncbi:MAG: thiamine-phosphate kinase [Spirochaetes bacterium]|nr:thiamine-phosphate kinase [Spirochaetota bacterium]
MGKGEFELIAAIRERLPPAGDNIGIGDDCAVIPGIEYDTLITTDILAEKVHFLLSYYTMYDVGYKACAVNASDILAMGGEVTGFFVSIAIPKQVSDSDILEFYRGFSECAGPFGVTVLGGDTTASKSDLFISVTATGRVKHGHALLRSTAHAGDIIYVLGRLGESAYGLKLLSEDHAHDRKDPFVTAHLRPPLYPELWQKIRSRYTITSAIDVSDGFLGDLFHILEMSGTSAEINADVSWSAVSSLPALAQTGKITSETARELLWRGGEDYALVFTSPETISESGILAAGRIVNGRPRIMLRENGDIRELDHRGYVHF